MNSNETMLRNAAKTISYHKDNYEIWQPMNKYNNQILYENTNAYQFQPIDQNCSTNSTSSEKNISHSIQRPIPILNSSTEQSKKQLLQKRNSTINIDSTIHSYGLPRSITSDHLVNNIPNRLYYYPSVRDVLDALNRRSFDKESYV